MRQAAVWPLVHAMQFPATLLGSGLAELGACPARDGFRGCARAVPTRAHSPARPERTPSAPPLAARARAGAAQPAGVNAAATASRPAAQRGRMPARNVAMPNSRPPSIYRSPIERIERWEGAEVHLAGGAHDDPQEALHKLRRLGRQQRQDKGFGEDKGHWSAQKRLNRR